MQYGKLRWLTVMGLLLALVLVGCGPQATPTPVATAIPAATAEVTVVATEDVAATAEATMEVMATDEATEEAGTPVAMVTTEEATMEAMATEEMAMTEAATAEATMAMTEEATMEAMATEEMVMTEAATAEATMAMTEEATMEAMATEEMAMTEAATAEATMEMTAEATAAATADATETMAMGMTVSVAEGENIVIGVASGLSGEGIAPLGVDIQRGAELALRDRPTVTVDGQEFTVTIQQEDEQCSAEGGQAVANRLASQGNIAAIVGHMCSSSCTAAAPIYDEAGLSMISPSCTAPNLTDGRFTSFNRVVPSDAQQGADAALYVYNELGITRVATIHDGSAYGEGLVNVFSATFEELGGEIVAADAVNVGGTDFRGLLNNIASQTPELVYFGGFPAEAARLIEQRLDAGLEDVPFMGADGIRGTEVIALAGEPAEGIYASSPVSTNPADYADFVARYEETYGETPPAPFHANAYDALNIILDAIEATASVEDGALVIDLDALRDYIKSATYSGLSGELNCDGTGECAVGAVDVFQVQDGVFVNLTNVAGEMDMDDMATDEAEATEEMMATDEAEATAEATAAS